MPSVREHVGQGGNQELLHCRDYLESDGVLFLFLRFCTFFVVVSISKTPNPPSSSHLTRQHRSGCRQDRATFFHSQPQPVSLSLMRRIPQKERLSWTKPISRRGFDFCLFTLDDFFYYYCFKCIF